MVIFHSYVSLPEGRYCNLKIGPKKACKGEYSTYCRLCECYTRTYHRAIGTEHDPYQGVLNKTRKPMSQVWNLCNFHLAWGYRSTHLERLRTCDVAPKLRGHVDLQPASILRPWSLKTGFLLRTCRPRSVKHQGWVKYVVSFWLHGPCRSLWSKIRMP